VSHSSRFLPHEARRLSRSCRFRITNPIPFLDGEVFSISVLLHLTRYFPFQSSIAVIISCL
jgi:hypothetical protein